MASARIDLHVHSTASDGTVPPEELPAAAAVSGLDVLALTDHDTTAGWAPATAALPDGLRLVRGVELSCARDRISVHLLGYLFDPAEPTFAAQRAALRDSRVHRAKAMADKLEAAGTGVTWQRVRAIAGGTVGRPHLAQALIEQGHIATVSEAFTPEWIGTGGRYWAPKLEVDVLDGIALVRAAGGVPVFAHPGAEKRGRTVGDDVIAEMALAGLAGLEVEHVDHDAAMREHLRGLAAELGLFTTGGSDFHGSAKPVTLGENVTQPDVLEQIEAQAYGVPVLTG